MTIDSTALAQRVDAALTTVQVGDISTPEEYAQAVAMLKKVKAIEKALATEEKKITDPLKQARASAVALFKPHRARCKELETDLKKAAADFKALTEKKRAELATAPLTRETANKLANTTTPAVEGISFVERTTFEVVDPDQVPRQYLQVNEKAIREGIKRGEEIPGVKVVKSTSVRAG